MKGLVLFLGLAFPIFFLAQSTVDLQVKISGSGNVTYDGYPDVTRNISGSGKLSRKRRQTKSNSRSEEHG